MSVNYFTMINVR